VTGTDPRHQHPAPESRPRSQATVLKERVELALDALESHSREFELGLLDKRARDIARPTKTDVAADSLSTHPPWSTATSTMTEPGAMIFRSARVIRFGAL
jgi:hypothetical protein